MKGGAHIPSSSLSLSARATGTEGACLLNIARSGQSAVGRHRVNGSFTRITDNLYSNSGYAQGNVSMGPLLAVASLLRDAAARLSSNSSCVGTNAGKSAIDTYSTVTLTQRVILQSIILNESRLYTRESIGRNRTGHATSFCSQKSNSFQKIIPNPYMHPLVHSKPQIYIMLEMHDHYPGNAPLPSTRECFHNMQACTCTLQGSAKSRARHSG